MSDQPFNLCVFCASSPRVEAHYLTLADDIGALCADQGWRLIYGGGRNGLMGAAADAALSGGADVVGVIPEILKEKEVAHSGLSELYVTDNMHERQMKMAELADGFVILPGGIGTLAEFFEIVTWRQLAIHQKPIALINHHEYWQPLIDMMGKAQGENFLHGSYDKTFKVFKDLTPLPAFFEQSTG